MPTARSHDEWSKKSAQALEHIHRSLDALVDLLKHLLGNPAAGTLRLSVTAVVGRSTTMIKPVPPLELSDIERVQLSLGAKLADGSTDPGPFSWESDNPSIGQPVGLLDSGEPDESNTTPSGPVIWVLTPAGPGVVTVTAQSASPNVNGNSIQITITEGRTGDVNLSAGTPVSDQ